MTNMKQYMRNRRKNNKLYAYNLLGNVCGMCGSTDNLEFDHIDRSTKKYDLADMWSHSREKLTEELKKCQLLCFTHHREKTLQDLGRKPAKGTHGTVSSYRYCHCQLCKDAKAEYARKRKQSLVV